MSDPDVIAWFDPGLTTGTAVYDIRDDRFFSSQCVAKQTDGGEYSYTALTDYVRTLHREYGERLAVGWELYIQTPRPRPGSKAVHAHRAIAAIREPCEANGVPIIKGQPSSARTALSTKVFLRRLGWYREGRQHANDAACHLFRHLIKMKPVPEKVLKGLPPGY